MDTTNLSHQRLVGSVENKLKYRSPILILSNGFMAYHQYLIGELDNGNWGVYNTNTIEPIDQFYLRSSALIAAKSHEDINIKNFHTIKQLDRKYWANLHNSVIFSSYCATNIDYDKYLILMDRLEDSIIRRDKHKGDIIKMFKSMFG